MVPSSELQRQGDNDFHPAGHDDAKTVIAKRMGGVAVPAMLASVAVAVDNTATLP
jgi:hypothetical protein